MSWDQKLRQLQEKLGLTPDGLAGTLGITTRTLADFMKPVGDGGREPTGPVQKLIDLLLGELDSRVAKMPTLNLVIIHGDFRVAGDQNPVDAIVNMHSEDGRQAQGPTFRPTGRSVGINEFHYVTVAPDRDKIWAMEGLIRRRIQPHFFVSKPGLDSQEARVCYFAATTVWLVTQAMRRDLAHITLAADAKKFWPLAQELKSLAEVDVTFVRETAAGHNAAVEELLQSIEIPIADPAGRKFGFVTKLAGDYGFITIGHKDSNEQAVVDGSTFFFSWNHMRKDRFGEPEISISKLIEGDFVSFSIGMNYKGPCATDVVLVERAPGAPPMESVSTQTSLPGRNRTVEEELVEIIKQAVTDCADEDEWALLSNVGTRISVRNPNFMERLQAIKHTKISALARAHPDLFELSNGTGTRYKAEIVRLKRRAR